MNPNETSTPTLTPTSIPVPTPANEPAKTAPAGPIVPEKSSTLSAPSSTVAKS